MKYSTRPILYPLPKAYYSLTKRQKELIMTILETNTIITIKTNYFGRATAFRSISEIKQRKVNTNTVLSLVKRGILELIEKKGNYNSYLISKYQLAAKYFEGEK